MAKLPPVDQRILNDLHERICVALLSIYDEVDNRTAQYRWDNNIITGLSKANIAAEADIVIQAIKPVVQKLAREDA